MRLLRDKSQEMKLPPHIITAISRLEACGYEAYLVGGCVRDAFLGLEPHDYDITTNALPEQTAACFGGLHVVEAGLKHGTLGVVIGGEMVDITTYRIEGAYSDRRRPDEVRFVSSLFDDLSRRDFTINAMAYNPKSGIIDPFSGRADAEKKLVRCVGEPDKRFNEDALRILRALRFASKLGFEIEKDTATSIRRNKFLLNDISAERVFSELKGILLGADAGRILTEYSEVFEIIMPEITPCIGFDQRHSHHCYDVWGHIAHTVDAAPPDPALRLTMLFHDLGKPQRFSFDETGGHFYGHPEVSAELAGGILTRLKCDGATRREVLTLVRFHDDKQRVKTRRGLRRLLSELGEPTLRRLLLVMRADVGGQKPEVRQAKYDALDEASRVLDEIISHESCFSTKDLAISGGELLALGYSGPAVGKELCALLQAVLDETLKNERAALLEKAKSDAKQVIQ